MNEGKLISSKQLKIDKDSQKIIIVLAVTSFIVVFSIIASKSLIAKYAYQNRVKKAMNTSITQVNQDKQNLITLQTSYNKFINQSPNIIGGSLTGAGDNIGTNEKIIKDALPATYDYPATLVAVKQLFNAPGITVTNIDSDQSDIIPPTTTTPQSTASSGTPSTTPMPLVFTVTASGNSSDINNLFTKIEQSIRPMQIQSIEIKGANNVLTAIVKIQTYYLPSSLGLTLNTEAIK